MPTKACRRQIEEEILVVLRMKESLPSFMVAQSCLGFAPWRSGWSCSGCPAPFETLRAPFPKGLCTFGLPNVSSHNDIDDLLNMVLVLSACIYLSSRWAKALRVINGILLLSFKGQVPSVRRIGSTKISQWVTKPSSGVPQSKILRAPCQSSCVGGKNNASGSWCYDTVISSTYCCAPFG